MSRPFELKREFKFKRSIDDTEFFLENFWHVLTIGHGWSQMTLWDHQHDILDMMTKGLKVPGYREVDLKARQIGFTTLGCATAFHDAWFNSDHPWIIVSQGLEEAKKTLQTKVMQPYSRLPRWLRARGPQIVRETAESIEFDNGSSITAIPSTASSGRSMAMFGTIMDEAAFMEDPDGVFSALDPLTYGPMFVFSTANGMGNFFHDTYTQAGLDESSWKRSFYPWSVVPGRDDQWYANKIATYINKEHLLAQEYPSTDVEAFLKSGRVALPVEQMQNEFCWCEPESTYNVSLINDIDPDTFALAQTPVGGDRPVLELRVWDPPHIERDDQGRVLREPNYVIGADIAEGLEHGDFNALSVANAYTGERVATMKAHVPIHLMGMVLAAVGYWYHNALLIVERNNTGLVPLEYLRLAGYPRLYRMEQLASQRRTDRTPRYGWVTTGQTKPLLVHQYVDAIIRGSIELHDKHLLQEATTFLSNGKGGFAATPPNHDDLVMADMITQRGIEDAAKHPPVFFDPDPGPITFGELFGTLPTSLEATSGVALSKPVGGAKEPTDVIRSFEMSERNIK